MMAKTTFRRMSLVAALLAAALLPLAAQSRVVERTYLATDKDVYVAGETVWYSAFCLDAATGGPSPVSSVAYVELHSADGLAATSKVALAAGRGGGRLPLPVALPTGNYRLVAYTAQNRDEAGYEYEGLAAKTISVFNVFSADRVKDGVEVVDAETYERLRAERSPVKPGSLPLRWEDGRLLLTNPTRETLSLSLSVWHDDGFLSNGNPGIDQFLAACRAVGPRTFLGETVPDYEG